MSIVIGSAFLARLEKQVACKLKNAPQTHQNPDPRFRFPINIYAISSKPEETFKDILNFTSLPFDKKILGEDLSKSNHGRWKKDIPKKSITNVKKILRLCLDKQGYK